MLLDTTSKSIEFLLGGATSANKLQSVAFYADHTLTTFTPASNDTESDGTNAVTLVAAPAASTERQIKYLSIYNKDTAAATVTVQLNNGGTTRILIKVTLAIGYTLQYHDHDGWEVLSAIGEIQYSSSGIGLHALDSASAHSIGSLTSGYLTKSNGTILVPATNTDTDVADAVSKKHSASGQFNQATSGEIAGLTNKASPTTNDFLLIEDAAAANAKKYITIGAIPAAAPAAHDLAGSLHNADTITNLNLKLSDGNVLSDKSAEISALTEKTSPIGADLIIIEDSAAANAKKKVQLSNILFPRYVLFADQFDAPVNADWAVNALAPAYTDDNNNSLTVRAFDDTTEEGVGFMVDIPTSATSIIFSIKGRAQTGPAGAQTVVLKLYSRDVPDNAAVAAWTAGTSLTALDIPTTTEYFQYDSQTISLATLGLTAGRVVQFELTRTGTAGGDSLAGDWNLLELKLSFI